jgi:hypothetical protein
MSLESSSFSLPPSPTIGQTYEYGGRTWQWDGRLWKQIAPAWLLTDPAGLVRLAYGSVNNVATLDFVLTSWTSKYRNFSFKLSGLVPVTDAVGFQCRFSTDGGATYNAGATDYDYAAQGTIDTAVAASLGSGGAALLAIASTATVGNGTGEGISASIELWKPTSAVLWNRITYLSYFISSAATPAGTAIGGGGAREAAQDTDAIRFMFSSGNISVGDYALYGWL